MSAYDHLLFLLVLAVVYVFKQWKTVLWLVTLFTIGHAISLFLATYGLLFNFGKNGMRVVEFLIPFTIFITAVVNVATAKKASQGKETLNLIFALFFGVIHGIGFSNYVRNMIAPSDNKFLLLLEFALGIEAAQLLIVLLVLLIGTLLQSFFKVARRDWILVSSAIAIGITIPLLIARWTW